MNRNKQIFRLPPLPAVFLSAALFGAACAGATAAPGLLAEYFDFIDTPLTDFPDLSGLVPDAVLVEPQIWHPSTSGAWDGLEAARFTDRFAARYSGFLDVPTNGTYTFALSSDDGSRLWIDGVLVVNHGGVHGMGRKAGAATLAAGPHELLLLYFENGGGAGLTLSWSGPGFGEEAVPASALSHDPAGWFPRPSAKMAEPPGYGFARLGDAVPLECAAWDGDAPAAAVSYLVDGVQLDAPPATNAPFTTEWTPPATGTYSVAAVALSADGLCATSAPVSVTALVPPDGMGWGLDAEYFDFRGLAYSDTPDLRGCAPAVTRTEDTVLFPQTHLAWDGLPEWMSDDFALRAAGWLAVREAGEYTLTLASDDASRLWIDGECLIDNGGIHQWRERSAAVALAAGLHRIRIEYFERAQASGVVLYWKTPERLRGPVPPSCLLRDLDVSADSDADGMPDAWETAWGLDPDAPSDAAGDADGDGVSNLSEFTAGTSPLGFTLPPASSAPGILAEFFPLGGSDPDAIPELDGLVPALVRADESVDFPGTPGIRAGLPPGLFPSAFAARFTGLLRVPSAGRYAFRLRSDDGSRLTLGETVLIDHDGLHGAYDRTATVWLASGDTPLLLEYFDAGGHSELALSWSGPGFAERPVSGSDLVRLSGASAPVVAVTAPADGAAHGEGNTVPLAASAASLDGEVSSVTLLLDGVAVSAAPGGWISAAWTNAAAGEHLVSAAASDSFGNCRTSLSVRVTVEPAPPGYAFGAESRFFPFPTNLAAIPATDGLAPALVRVDDALDFPETTNAWEGLPAAMADRFASVHGGYLWVRESGDYTLALRSDDGSRLTLDGETAIDHGGCHSMSRKSVSLRLLAGCHPFRLEYFENAGKSGLSLLWSGPGFAERPVEPTALLRQTGEPDADGDGMPDWWESMHGLDPLTPAAPGLDTDGDGIPDLGEFLETGTVPESPDTDGDGLPDKWEADNGTDPLVWDRLDDPDGDGLCNFDEFLAGTDPLDPDTDGDGLPDGDELHGAGTDPLSPDSFTPPDTAVSSPAPASASALSVSCRAFGASVRCRRRGRMEFPVSLPGAGIHALSIRLSVTPGGTAAPPALVAWIDGSFAGVRRPGPGEGTALWYTPYLAAGAHTVSVFFDGFAADASCEILSVELLAGSDPAAWETRSRAAVAARSGFSSHADGASHVSPACVEGFSLHPGLCSASSGGVPVPVLRTGERAWCADLPLDGGPATLSVSFENGGAEASRTVVWTPLNAPDAPARVNVRAGDALRLSCSPAGAAPDAPASVSVDGAAAWSGTASGFATLSFAEPGERTVTASCGSFSKTFTLAVYGGAFPPAPPVCMPGRERLWAVAIPEGPRPALSPGSMLAARWTGGGTALLSHTAWEPQPLVMRAGAGGPVLAATEVSPIWLAATPSSFLNIVEASPDGYDTRQADLLAWGMRPGVTVEIAAYTAGVLLDDFSRSRTLTEPDFGDSGVYLYRLVHPDGSAAETCHTVKAYQDGELIGEAWYGGEALSKGVER